MANIKNYLDNIKNAMFGKEVRGSIHDGIDAINKEVESTTGRQEHLEATFDELIINAGNSNAELVDARVGENGQSFNKLGDRLDNFDSQLDHIENKSWVSHTINSDIFKNVKKWNATGDSITWGQGTNITYHDFIKEYYSIEYVNNYAIKGTCISIDNEFGTAMCKRYVDMENDVDLITVMGGVNDFIQNVELDVFENGVITLLKGLLAKYNLSYIFILSPLKVKKGWWNTDINGRNNIGYLLDDYINILKKNCMIYSIPFVDLNNACHINLIDTDNTALTTTDGLHPNTFGHFKIAMSATYINRLNKYKGGTHTVDGQEGYYTDKGIWTTGTSNKSSSKIKVVPGRALEFIKDDNFSKGAFITYLKDDTFVKWDSRNLAILDKSKVVLESGDYNHIIIGGYYSSYEDLIAYDSLN